MILLVDWTLIPKLLFRSWNIISFVIIFLNKASTSTKNSVFKLLSLRWIWIFIFTKNIICYWVSCCLLFNLRIFNSLLSIINRELPSSSLILCSRRHKFKLNILFPAILSLLINILRLIWYHSRLQIVKFVLNLFWKLFLFIACTYLCIPQIFKRICNI